MNYHHLHYFWTVAREGGVSRAAEVLGVAQPTVSAQLAALERAVKQPLFVRGGRGLTLTEAGKLAYDYADEIFRLGGELQAAFAEGRATTPRLVVGVADVLPKLVVHRLLEPVLAGEERLVVVEDKPERLVAELALHNLDVVLTDGPAPPGVKVRAFNHLLGETGTTFCAAPSVKLAGRFPRSLDGAPVLLPLDSTTLRRALDQWFAEEGVRPVVRGEFADTALMKVFGAAGAGVYPVPTAVEGDALEQYGAVVVGRAERVRNRVYAVTVQRKLRHPAVAKVCETARTDLFG
ncbi:LysR family transcriptional regulator [Urbifossiella limnaea]|uniref:Transcriptional activator protein NhaR n=1 Tax=Urbifossiella limnaea TaxID=2528023 RepID=A0A517XNX5_9BACT|nr:LysR family transcriptional regulator [Urbifossiella limnaea]QDU19203.1 Transcriptional activator protein NhaR [Urbifossiella limnaea]